MSGALKQDFQKRAEKIFKSNLMTGYSDWKKTEIKFIAPAARGYVYQWLWDTAFHAIVLSHFDIEWAKGEIRTFLLGQRSDGFLPHVIFWGGAKILPRWAYLESDHALRPNTTGITQPPMFPLAVESIYQKDKDKKFLEEVLDKLAANHTWLLKNRDPDKDFLISIISTNESLDESPVFQPQTGYLGNEPEKVHLSFRKADLKNKVFRFNSQVILKKDYFNFEELLFNCIFIESARSLARLYNEIGRKKDAKKLNGIAAKSEKSLLEKCWDDQDEIFYPLYSKQERMAKIKTVTSFIPLFLELLIKKHLLNSQEFWTEYPVPSVAKNEPYYFPKTPEYRFSKLLWRGPTWINTNWFIVKGLKKHGYHKVANHIVKKSLEMIQKYGFREYYNPETGQGYSHKNFGWSTLILDLL